MSLINAFLLTRQYQDRPTGIELTFWLCSDNGPLKLVVDRQKAIMFIQQNDLHQAKTLLSSIPNLQFRDIQLKTFSQSPVTAIYFPSMRSFYTGRDLLQKNAIPCYETDIRPTERFLTERFITADIALQAPLHGHEIHNPRLKPGHYQPDFTILSLDIESDFQSNELFSISLYNKEHAITLMRGDKNHTTNSKVEYFDNTRALLGRFLHWVDEINPDIIIGWNVINFDFRFLQKKFDQYKLPFNIGRDHTQAIWRKSRSDNEHYFLLIPGRVVLDGIDTLKSATYHFDSFSLDFVSQQLLDRGKLIKASDHQYDPLYKAKEIQHLFHNDKASLAAYNLEDCKLVWDIFEHAELVDFAIERARLTGLEMDRVGGSVAAFDNLYLPRLHRKGYIAPNISDHTDTTSAPGGYVMNSKPGLHDSVLVLDFKSLYPSIILTFHIDPYARIMAKQQDKEETIPGFNGASFSKNEYILPDIIKQLWAARDKAKQNKNKALSQAIKIIMNSFYGVLGTPGCRIHDSRLTSSITLRGHEIMQTSAQLIEDLGYEVIYGDTDSVFVSLSMQADDQQADEIGNSLIKHINNYWKNTLQECYGIYSFLEMEYETHYQRFFMPTIRGSEKGSKKRYAGLQGNKIIFKGLESVRSDWTRLARDFQQILYKKIFSNEPYKDYILETIKNLQNGLYDEQLIYKKRLRQKLQDYNRNIPPHARAALKAEDFFKKNGQPSRYLQPGWIEYVMTTNGPETLECQQSPLDYQHYIDKQLSPIADTILTVLNTSMEEISQKQISLFDQD